MSTTLPELKLLAKRLVSGRELPFSFLTYRVSVNYLLLPFSVEWQSFSCVPKVRPGLTGPPILDDCSLLSKSLCQLVSLGRLNQYLGVW